MATSGYNPIAQSPEQMGCGIVSTAKPSQRIRRKCMARRSGQNGRIERKGNVLYARFWLDVPGQESRAYKCARICPASGPGSLNKFEQKLRLKQIIDEAGANSEEAFRQAEAANLGTTFKERAERWFEQVQRRKRNPIKPRTADAWATALRYINPKIGEMPLASVNNLAMKNFITIMAGEQKEGRPRFSAKSITNYVQIIKMVVGSAINDKGEEIYPVKWNHDFIDLPVIKNQRTPTFSAEEISSIIAAVQGQYSLLYAVLAGSGLRIEEAVALKAEDIRDTVIHVRHSHWRRKLYSPKSDAGTREVDLHSSLAEALHNHIGGRASGFVFQTRRGTPLHRSNLLRRSLHKILVKMGREKCGFHAFRRFRVTYLRKQRVPEDLLKFWIGHAPETVTDGYSKMKEDRKFRAIVAERIGLGFHMPIVAAGLPVAPIAPSLDQIEMVVSA